MIVRRCAWSYPLMWGVVGGVALAVGAFANSTWAAGYDSGGLGAMLGTFFLAAVIGNVLWVGLAASWLTRFGRLIRSTVAAAAVPLVAVALGFAVGPMLVPVVAVIVPGPIAWWATQPRHSERSTSETSLVRRSVI